MPALPRSAPAALAAVPINIGVCMRLKILLGKWSMLGILLGLAAVVFIVMMAAWALFVFSLDPLRIT